MSSPRTLKINKLRRKNRALLDKLESNSALLECRLKKLNHTAKVEKHSDKSWEDLPPSPLKRKFQCWRARNYSGQVSALLHRNLCDCTENSSDTVDAEVQMKENVEENPITSPTKRTRHNILLVSNPRRKSSPKPHSKSHSPPKSSITNAYNVTKEHMKHSRSKSRSTCHCINLTYENETSLNEGDTSSSVPPCSCSKAQSPKKYSTEKENSPKVCMNKRTLETAKSMLMYSPESEFLRRLKKRSQTLENLLSPGNIRNVPKVFPVHAKSIETVSDKIIKTKKPRVSPKKSSAIKHAHFNETSINGKAMAVSSKDLSSRPVTAKSPIKYFPNRLTAKSPIRDIPSKTSPSRDVYSKPALRDFDSMSPPRDISSRPLTAKSPLHISYSPTKETKSKKKTRKRVCYRKNCYCRVQQKKPKVKRKIIEDVKENLTEEDTIRDVSSSEEPTSSCGCHCCCNCDCKRKSPPPKVPLLMTDTISSLVDNEVKNKYIRGQCCDCDKGSSWFNKLNDFRQSHYFDCHAYPSSQSLDSARNLETMSGQPLGHKCVHKYTVDDRFFAKPLYSDHQNNSRCTICHLPFGAAKARKDGLLPITLPSKLDDPIIQVSIPLGKSKLMSPRTSSYKKSIPKVKSRLTSRTIGDFKAWMPPPADSLALRYQKGVFK